MRVNLHLLESEPAESPQTNALQQSLERNLHNPRQDGNPRKFDRGKNFDFLIEHFLDV